MKKSIKKSGIFLSAAFAVALAGQVAYAQAPSTYTYYRLEATGYKDTPSVVKTNNDGYADNYVSYIGWPGSGIDWWINQSGSRVSDIANFSSTGISRSFYSVSGASLNGKSVAGLLKTDASTWHQCDVSGNIYP